MPTGGFAIPRARVASGAPLALVAAGALAPPRTLGFARRVDTAWRLFRRFQAELLAETDDRPALVAALLAEVDDRPGRFAQLLDELDDGEDFNWVDDAGGLPSYIKRIATHLQEKGMDQSRAIATAVNAAKKMCADGDTNLPGVQQVNAGSRAEACAAVADWEAKKAKTKG